MKCPMETGQNEILLAYSSGDANAGDVLFLDGHVPGCAACRAFVEAQRTVWDALDVWEAAPVASDFNRQVFQRIDGQVSWWQRMLRSFEPLGLRPGITLAASAGVILMAGLLIQRAPAPLPVPQRDTAQMETVQPEQLVLALDEMEALSQLSRPVHAEKANSEM